MTRLHKFTTQPNILFTLTSIITLWDLACMQLAAVDSALEAPFRRDKFVFLIIILKEVILFCALHRTTILHGRPRNWPWYNIQNNVLQPTWNRCSYKSSFYKLIRSIIAWNIYMAIQGFRSDLFIELQMTFGGSYASVIITFFSIFIGILLYCEFFLVRPVPAELFGPSAYRCQHISCRYYVEPMW